MSSSTGLPELARSRVPDTVPLTGADCFLRAFDDEIRRKCGASHASQLVLRLGPGLDMAAFRGLIADVAAANPILHAPVRRRLGIGPPVFRLLPTRPGSVPRVDEHSHPGPPARTPDLFFQRMNQRFDGRRGQLLHFDTVSYDGGQQGTDLAMTWLHLLFDGAGSEVFVRWLDECHRGLRSCGDLPADDVASISGLPDGLSARERGQRAMAWQASMTALGDSPPRSLAGPLSPVPQALRYRVDTLDERDTARVLSRAREKAGFLTPMLYFLAASIRAHHVVYEARGLDARSYVVPLPVDLRPKGPEQAIFQTRVSLLWFRVFPDVVKDFDTLLGELKRQRRSAIKDDLVINGAIAMDYARYAPMRVYAHMARRAFRGELCSFFFAYTGEFAAGLEEFLGAKVLNAFHAPAVPPSPGSASAIGLYGGRMNVTHVYQHGVFSSSERERFREQMLADLLGDD